MITYWYKWSLGLSNFHENISKFLEDLIGCGSIEITYTQLITQLPWK